MDSNIICPTCKNKIPLSEAFAHELREQLRAKAVEYAKKKDAEYQQKLEKERLKYQKERETIQKDIETKTRKRIEDELSLKFQDTKNEAEELKKEKLNLQNQLLELNKTLRQLATEKEQQALELEKKLAHVQSKIRDEEKKRFDEEYRLKQLEYEKKISDVSRVNDELRRKLEQGSQQTQGEVLELELENLLRAEFPLDTITPVEKGISGGDVIQVVRNSMGKPCGTIMWETKRTKSWMQPWIKKLKDDQRNIKAEIAVIISEVLPPEIKNFGFREGVWVGNFSCIIGLAYALRRNLLDIAVLKVASEGKKEKMEILYNYIYGTEFRHRIEAIKEAFDSLQADMEKEKRWFTAKWAKQEKDIRKVLDNTMGLSGDLQSITGKELQEVANIDLLPDGFEQ